MDGNSTMAMPPANQSGPRTFQLIQHLSPEAAWVLLVVECIFFLLSVVGNVLVLITYCKSYKIRAIPHNVFIVALAIADLVLGVFTIPMHVYKNVIPNIMDPNYPIPPHYQDKALCLAGMLSISQPLTWSATTLVLVAADRLIATMWPLRYHKIMSHWKAVFFVILTWILTSVPLYVSTAMSDLMTYNPKKPCLMHFQYLPEMRQATVILWGGAQLMLCYILYIAVTIGMCCGPSQIARQKSLTRMMAIVLIVFTICVVPNLLMNLLGTTGLSRNVNFTLGYTFFGLMHFNSCVNPIIYSFAHKTFRHRFRQMLCGGTSSDRNNSGSSNEKTVYEVNNAAEAVTEKI